MATSRDVSHCHSVHSSRFATPPKWPPFDEQPKPPNLAKRGGCWFETESVKIHLGVDKEFRPATKAHPGLLVEDLPSIVAACRAAGFDVNDDEPLEGYDRAYVKDPFGNRLELLEQR